MLTRSAFYEYLIKAYVYNSELNGKYLERWLLAAESTMNHIGSHPYGHPEWTLLPSWSDKGLSNRMETLSWFAGGNFILGGMVTKNKTLIDYGLSIADAAGGVYNMTATGLGPEFITWRTECPNGGCGQNSVKNSDGRYRMRPEVLETWYYAYRATRNPKYIQWSWNAFEAINKTCRTDYGFSAISNVDAADGGSRMDKQESFLFAEVFKYLYLIHAGVSTNLSRRDDLANTLRMVETLFTSRIAGLEHLTLGFSTLKHTRCLSQVLRYDQPSATGQNNSMFCCISAI